MQLEYNIYEIWILRQKTQDDNTIHQLQHNKTNKIKIENNRYWLWDQTLFDKLNSFQHGDV